MLQQVEPSAIIPADVARTWSRVWIIDSAFAQTIAVDQPEVAGDRRLEAEQQLQQWIEEGVTSPVTPSEPGYDFLVRRAWLHAEPLTGDPLIQETVISLLQENDVEVSGRLGSWDGAALQVIPVG